MRISDWSSDVCSSDLRRIASALPIGFATLPDTGEQLRFVGEPTRMRFVADLPDYLGRGGPHLHDVELFDDGDSSRLAVSFTVVAAARAWPDPASRGPDTLPSQLSDVHFRYRELDRDNVTGACLVPWDSARVATVEVRAQTVSTGTVGIGMGLHVV